MRKSRFTSLCLGLTLLAGGVQQVYAAPIPILNNDTLAPPRNDFDGMVGYDVQVGATSQNITALGMLDQDLNGLSQAHQVGLWDSGGTLLASVTVPAGTGAPLNGWYRYVNLSSPVTVTAGQTYTLGLEVFAGGDHFKDIDGNTTNAPEFIMKNGRYNVGGGFAQPTVDAIFFAPFEGPNALFEPVPEPGSAMLMLGGIAAFALRRKK
jgi:hypothetical protein